MLRHALRDPKLPANEDPTWLLEERSTSTRTNALLSLELVKERGLHSVVVVTSGFHQYRSERVFKRVAKDMGNKYGMQFQIHIVDFPDDIQVEGNNSDLLVAQLNWFRELAAIVYYFTRGWL